MIDPNVQHIPRGPQGTSEYSKHHDLFADKDKMDQAVYDYFRRYDFELDQSTVIGFGRTGYVIGGQAWSLDSPEAKHSAAFKIGDIFKIPILESELKNEVRVLMYANQRELRCVPKLLWAGYFGYGAQFYVVCTQLLPGYHKDLKSLNATEDAFYREALEELKSANIKHGDLQKSNILFTQQQAYIIDFGESTIITANTSKRVKQARYSYRVFD